MFTRNQIQLTGNIARSAETRSVGDSTVTRARLLHNDIVRKSGEEPVERLVAIDLEIWDKPGEVFAEHVTTKTPVYVEGKLMLDQWKSEDGKPRSKLYLRAEQWQFLAAPAQDRDRNGGSDWHDKASNRDSRRDGNKRRRQPF